MIASRQKRLIRDVVDYLVKPFDRERFQRAFNCAVRDVRQPRGRENGEVINESLEDHGDLRGDRLTIKSDRAYVVIDPCDVDWISAAKNYSELHMGRKNYSVRGTKNLVTRKMRELANSSHRTGGANSAIILIRVASSWRA